MGTGRRLRFRCPARLRSRRLSLREGLQTLTASPAPRWAIRATRLYAQARLSRAASGPPGSIAEEWGNLRTQFAELAGAHGARWAELPWEALLTVGLAGRGLEELAPQLLSDPEQQAEAIRCVKLRFSHAEACDPLVGAPIVSWLVNAARSLDNPRSYGPDPAGELIASWLRGVARRESADQDISQYRLLRSQVRDALLRRDLEPGEEQRLESLALLGADSSDAAVRHVNTIDYLGDAAQSHLTQLPASDLTPSIEVSYDGWLLPKGGVAFVWVLDSELETSVQRGSRRAA